jgi:hypothetical protein
MLFRRVAAVHASAGKPPLTAAAPPACARHAAPPRFFCRTDARRDRRVFDAGLRFADVSPFLCRALLAAFDSLITDDFRPLMPPPMIFAIDFSFCRADDTLFEYAEYFLRH